MFFLSPIRFSINVVVTSPTTTRSRSGRLKFSGRESKPFEGANRVKKMSGPPYAKIRESDSKLADAEIMEETDDTC